MHAFARLGCPHWPVPMQQHVPDSWNRILITHGMAAGLTPHVRTSLGRRPRHRQREKWEEENEKMSRRICIWLRVGAGGMSGRASPPASWEEAGDDAGAVLARPAPTTDALGLQAGDGARPLLLVRRAHAALPAGGLAALGAALAVRGHNHELVDALFEAGAAYHTTAHQVAKTAQKDKKEKKEDDDGGDDGGRKGLNDTCGSAG